MSINQELHDELVDHQVDVLRTVSGFENSIDKLVIEVHRSLAELVTRHDITSRTTELFVQRQASVIIDRGYTKIFKLLEKSMRGMAKIEKDEVMKLINQRIKQRLREAL